MAVVSVNQIPMNTMVNAYNVIILQYGMVNTAKEIQTHALLFLILLWIQQRKDVNVRMVFVGLMVNVWLFLDICIRMGLFIGGLMDIVGLDLMLTIKN